MFFKKRVFKNQLTKLLGNPDTTLEMTLLHNDFYDTTKNEADILIQKILGTENDEYNNEWFKKIIDYALFDAEPPEKERKNNRKKQFNNNASHFLERCGKKFIDALKKSKSDSMDYLMKSLDKFISNKNKTKKDPYYAGHFQRFIEKFIRLKAFDDLDEVLDKIIPFLIENCYILAYQQLITVILGDFSATLDDKVVYDLLDKMLFRANSAVSYIYEHSSDILSQSAVDVEINTLKKEKIYKKIHQPLNLRKKAIPLIDKFIDEYKDEKEREGSLSSSQKEFYNKLEKKNSNNNFEYQTVEDAEFKAYLLIMSIRVSSYDQTELIEKFRNDEENNYQLIEALLYCGTFCGETSIVSLEAFRLLDIIFNGSAKLWVDPWMLIEQDKLKLKFYKDYADNFNFSPKTLSYQMVHALPIFWDHRYNIESYETLENEKTEFDVSEYYSDLKLDKKIKKKWMRDKGETAIEILQPCLICDPPISSFLNYTVINIFVMLSKYRKKLRNNEEQTIDTRDRMLYIDGTYYNFYNHHFIIKGKNKSILDLLEVIIPLPSSDEQYKKEKSKRTPLSGFIIDFSLRMTNKNLNVFFDINENTSISSLGHSEVFKLYGLGYEYIDYYRKELKYDLLPLNTLYNISIHKDEIYGNYDLDDFEEEEENLNKMIIIKVDEIDDQIRHSKHKEKKTKGTNSKNSNTTNNKEKYKSKRDSKRDADSKNDDDNNSSDDEEKSKTKRISKNSNKNTDSDNDDNSNSSDDEEKSKPKHNSRRDTDSKSDDNDSE